MSSNVTTIDLRGHTGDCAVTAHRVSLLDEIQRVYNNDSNAFLDAIAEDRPTKSIAESWRQLRPLLGAAIEYYGMGDQEVEGCTCGAAHLPVDGTAVEVDPLHLSPAERLNRNLGYGETPYRDTQFGPTNRPMGNTD